MPLWNRCSGCLESCNRCCPWSKEGCRCLSSSARYRALQGVAGLYRALQGTRHGKARKRMNSGARGQSMAKQRAVGR